jgi:hypothetical protein
MPNFRPLKPMQLRKDGKPNRNYVEDPLQKVIREKLEQLRNERLEFMLVGDPAACTHDCWQKRAAQEAEARALKAYGDTVKPAQFPMMCLRSEDEIDASFRGYILRCHCLPELSADDYGAESVTPDVVDDDA